MSMKLSSLYSIVREDIQEHLDNSLMQVGFSTYGVPSMTPMITYGDIIDFNIEQLIISKNKSEKANVGLFLTYKGMSLEEDHLQEVSKQQYFMLLNSEVDIDWSFGMIQKVWNGNYPSTVAIDKDGKCYFVYVEQWGIHFSYFALLGEQELDMLSTYLNDDSPFKITIAPKAMFKVIDGTEGYNYLRKNIVVEFNCSTKLSIMVEDFGGFSD